MGTRAVDGPALCAKMATVKHNIYNGFKKISAGVCFN
jgi:hypothetical protein